MGKILSMMTRPIKNYNIESRAHKIISQEKPVPAPKFKANVKETERLLKENPDSFTDLSKKHTVLDENLRSVYVKSHDPEIEIKRGGTEDRPLPLNRRIVEQPEFGFAEPNKVPVGRCTLRQSLKFLTDYQSNPEVWTSTKIALEYKIPEDTIRNILEYFRIYQIYIPEKKSKATFAGPAPLRKQLDDTRHYIDGKTNNQ